MLLIFKLHLCTYNISWAGKLASAIYKGALHTAAIRVFRRPALPAYPSGCMSWGPKPGEETKPEQQRWGHPLLPLPLPTLGLWRGWGRLKGQRWETDVQLGLSPLNKPLINSTEGGKSKRLHICNISQNETYAKIVIIKHIKCVQY